MANLEDAIKLAHNTVYKMNDDSMELDRSGKFAARRRLNENHGPGMAVVSKGGRMNKVGNGFFDEEPNSEARFWKAKFEELQHLQVRPVLLSPVALYLPMSPSYPLNVV